MKLFNKNYNEQLAIEHLKQYDSRYRNLKKSECPDFISEEESIGVEVTIVEFNEFIHSFNYEGKTLIEFARMKGIKPIPKKTFEFINKQINNREILDEEFIIDFIDTYYYKRGDEILKINTIDEYKKLDPNINLYQKNAFPNEKLINGQKIIGFLPTAFWMGEIVDKYIEAVQEKNKKLNHYIRFKENSLLLINFTGELEETLTFEKRIRQIDGINFDKIFVLNVLFNSNIYEINLRSHQQ